MPSKRQITLQTTYLSERLWVLRRGDERAVFERTETRSVLDRRGLVAAGQLKPSDDEQIRYGKLLFGEEKSDFVGWEESQKGEQALKNKLLR